MTTLIDIRHPEKHNRPDSPTLSKPPWIRVRAPSGAHYQNTRNIVRSAGLHTVCEEAACPNINECWNQKHATFMILGDTCTRACSFCNVRTGKPTPPDASEPARVGNAVARLDLRHVVVTSVDRDDLDDGGAAHFIAVIGAIQACAPSTTIEILTPDFRRRPGAIESVIDAGPDVFNHNLETVPRLYGPIRPGARYYHSLRLLQMVKERDPAQFTKSGLMVGLGETRQEILQVMDDMVCAGVDFITIGQYLQPTRKHAPVDRYWTPDEFASLKRIALAKGFIRAAASPLTRSSYHAGDDFAALQAARRTGN